MKRLNDAFQNYVFRFLCIKRRKFGREGVKVKSAKEVYIRKRLKTLCDKRTGLLLLLRRDNNERLLKTSHNVGLWVADVVMATLGLGLPLKEPPTTFPGLHLHHLIGMSLGRFFNAEKQDTLWCGYDSAVHASLYSRIPHSKAQVMVFKVRLSFFFIVRKNVCSLGSL